MPKISVRVVPEASISASMRPLRSAIFLSSVRTSRSTSEANRRLRRGEAPPLGRIERRMRAARSAESFPVTPSGEKVPQKRVKAVERPGALCNQVFAPLGKQAQHFRGGFGIYGRQAFVARGGQGGGEGLELIVLAGVAAREQPHSRRELGRHVHHRLA